MSVGDAWELWLLESSFPFAGERLLPWLFREETIARQATLERVQVLVAQLSGATTPEERERIEGELRRCNEC